jgi:hypothetical protein
MTFMCRLLSSFSMACSLAATMSYAAPLWPVEKIGGKSDPNSQNSSNETKELTADIHANLFLQRINPEPTHGIEEEEVATHDSEGPRKDKQHSNQLDSHQCEVTAAVGPFIDCNEVRLSC